MQRLTFEVDSHNHALSKTVTKYTIEKDSNELSIDEVVDDLIKPLLYAIFENPKIEDYFSK